jgi:transcription initiation factor TFIIIB Brf1 subunit/transcription initiation factor TFIIB
MSSAATYQLQQCPTCQSTDLETNDSSGDTVCTNCGTVLEESHIVSSIEFVETAAGTSSVIGQFVSATATKPYGVSGPGYGLSRESREVAIENGRRMIVDVAGKLHLNAHFIDSAHRLYILAVHHHFTQGRRTAHVVAACLYIVCRREKSPHLLIDFAEALSANLYTLGACFLKFTRLLSLNLPVIDPSLYIHRFAERMDLGASTHATAMMALRLVSRMKRDWIQTGRRPAGICGACLLIAARAHGFRRTRQEITQIVRVTDITLRNRLAEFENTASSMLTAEEFEKLELTDEADPPSFVRGMLEEEFAKETALLEDAYNKDMTSELNSSETTLESSSSSSALVHSSLTTFPKSDTEIDSSILGASLRTQSGDLPAEKVLTLLTRQGGTASAVVGKSRIFASALAKISNQDGVSSSTGPIDSKRSSKNGPVISGEGGGKGGGGGVDHKRSSSGSKAADGIARSAIGDQDESIVLSSVPESERPLDSATQQSSSSSSSSSSSFQRPLLTLDEQRVWTARTLLSQNWGTAMGKVQGLLEFRKKLRKQEQEEEEEMNKEEEEKKEKDNEKDDEKKEDAVADLPLETKESNVLLSSSSLLKKSERKLQSQKQRSQDKTILTKDEIKEEDGEEEEEEEEEEEKKIDEEDEDDDEGFNRKKKKSKSSKSLTPKSYLAKKTKTKGTTATKTITTSASSSKTTATTTTKATKLSPKDLSSQSSSTPLLLLNKRQLASEKIYKELAKDMAVQLQAHNSGAPQQKTDMLLPFGSQKTPHVQETQEENDEQNDETLLTESSQRGTKRVNLSSVPSSFSLKNFEASSKHYNTVTQTTMNEEEEEEEEGGGETTSSALVLFDASSSSSAPILSQSLSVSSEQLLVRARTWKPSTKVGQDLQAPPSLGPSSALDVSAANRDFIIPPEEESSIIPSADEDENEEKEEGNDKEEKEEEDDDNEEIKSSKTKKRLMKQSKNIPTSTPSNGTIDIQNDTLIDVSDFLLEPDEASKRKTVWERMHSNYLKERAEKQGARTLTMNENGEGGKDEGEEGEGGTIKNETVDEASSTKGSPTLSRPASKKATKKPIVAVQASSKIAASATEGAINLLSTNRLSKKLNYEAMESLNRLFDHHGDKDAVTYVDDLPPRILTKKRIRRPSQAKKPLKSSISSVSASALIDVQIPVPISTTIQVLENNELVNDEPKAKKGKKGKKSHQDTSHMDELNVNIANLKTVKENVNLQELEPVLAIRENEGEEEAAAVEAIAEEEDANERSAFAISEKVAKKLVAKKERKRARKLLKAEEAAKVLAETGNGAEGDVQVGSLEIQRSHLVAPSSSEALPSSLSSSSSLLEMKKKAVPIKRKFQGIVASQSSFIAAPIDDEEDDELIGESSSKWAKVDGDDDKIDGDD